MRSRKKLLPVLLPAALFFILLYLLVQLYRRNDTSTDGNPVIEEGYADPEMTIFDSSYWIFPTFSAPFSDQVFMDAYSSPDLIRWTRHAHIIDTAPGAPCKDHLGKPLIGDVINGAKFCR